jgi:hypothetical protein
MKLPVQWELGFHSRGKSSLLTSVGIPNFRNEKLGQSSRLLKLGGSQTF